MEAVIRTFVAFKNATSARETSTFNVFARSKNLLRAVWRWLIIPDAYEFGNKRCSARETLEALSREHKIDRMNNPKRWRMLVFRESYKRFHQCKFEPVHQRRVNLDLRDFMRTGELPHYVKCHMNDLREAG